MNTDLLIDAATNILNVPETFSIWAWFSPRADAPCGTVGCIAGHIKAMTLGCETLAEASMSYDIGAQRIAARELDLNEVQERKLFFLYLWPDNFHRAYFRCRSAKARAQVNYDRILHFIATEGRE